MVSMSMTMGHTNLTAYLAPREHPGEHRRDFTPDLRQELQLRGIKILRECGRLLLCEGPLVQVVFAQDTWTSVEIKKFQSISEAAEILREHKSKYVHYSYQCHRRGELILEKLPTVKIKKFDFLATIPTANLGAFTLLSENEMLFTRATTSSLPFGEIHFNEDKINPPSRAYLKLWELFTLYRIKPNQHDRVIDVGSCPGGWTWVLQTIGCQVLSVDKAPLDPRIASLPNIEFKMESAFGLRPMHVGPLDWFFSDIICYPHKLYELVNRYREYGNVANFACTIKFQSQTDFDTMFKFEEIPHSKIVHLSCNKHEVTWIMQSPVKESLL